MAVGRILKTQISLSEQVNDLSLKAALLFTWMIPHADDFGRLPDSSRRIKAMVAPMRDDISCVDVDSCICEMVESGLILRMNGAEPFLQFPSWDTHQSGLKQKSESRFAPRDGVPLSASEKDIEDMLCSAASVGGLLVNSRHLTSFDRQVRVGNRYIDIVGTLDDGRKVIFELKRQRITLAAIQQVTDYAELVGGSPIKVVMGCGMAGNVDVAGSDIIFATFDQALKIKNINRLDGTGVVMIDSATPTDDETSNDVKSQQNQSFASRACAEQEQEQEQEINTPPPPFEGGATAKPKKPKRELGPEFERFYSAYPKKVARADAEKAWLKIKLDDGMLEKIMAGLERAKRSTKWQEKNGEFIPYPASWLNGRRWEDEVASSRAGTSSDLGIVGLM